MGPESGSDQCKKEGCRGCSTCRGIDPTRKYEPWTAQGITETDYWKQRFVEVRKELEGAQQEAREAYGRALTKVYFKTVYRDPGECPTFEAWCRTVEKK